MLQSYCVFTLLIKKWGEGKMPEPGRSDGAFAQPILLTLDYVKLMPRKKTAQMGESSRI